MVGIAAVTVAEALLMAVAGGQRLPTLMRVDTPRAVAISLPCRYSCTSKSAGGGMADAAAAVAHSPYASVSAAHSPDSATRWEKYGGAGIASPQPVVACARNRSQTPCSTVGSASCRAMAPPADTGAMLTRAPSALDEGRKRSQEEGKRGKRGEGRRGGRAKAQSSG